MPGELAAILSGAVLSLLTVLAAYLAARAGAARRPEIYLLWEWHTEARRQATESADPAGGSSASTAMA